MNQPFVFGSCWFWSIYTCTRTLCNCNLIIFSHFPCTMYLKLPSTGNYIQNYYHAHVVFSVHKLINSAFKLMFVYILKIGVSTWKPLHAPLFHNATLKTNMFLCVNNKILLCAVRHTQSKWNREQNDTNDDTPHLQLTFCLVIILANCRYVCIYYDVTAWYEKI